MERTYRQTKYTNTAKGMIDLMFLQRKERQRRMEIHRKNREDKRKGKYEKKRGK